jgi:hypothetical protein
MLMVDSIVFVHGFTGHPGRTWTQEVERRGDTTSGSANQPQPNGDSSGGRATKLRRLVSTTREKVYWPRDLVPASIPSARILTYGYDTHIRHSLVSPPSKNTVYDISNELLVNLEAERRQDPSRPLLFVVHSLGGIVVKEALRQSRSGNMNKNRTHSIFLATTAIVFFGTPHGGSDPFPIARGVALRLGRALGIKVNEDIVRTLMPSSERLRELRDEFIPMARERNWIIYSFQEQYGVQVLEGKVLVLWRLR